MTEGLVMSYPAGLKQKYDPIVARMAKSFHDPPSTPKYLQRVTRCLSRRGEGAIRRMVLLRCCVQSQYGGS